MRKVQPSLAQGDYVDPQVTGSAMSFQRVLGNERSLVLINYGTSAVTLNLANLPAKAVFTPGYPTLGSDIGADGNGQASTLVPAQTVRVYVFRS